MTTYPTVNWWPGCLRPYESGVSFVLRFCVLNCIPLKQGIEFLGVNQSDRDRPDIHITRVAELLHENIRAVEAIFSGLLSFSEHSYVPPFNSDDQKRVRYCKECAKYGYHSCLHEIEWIVQCPFHLCEIAEEYLHWSSSSTYVRRLETLEFLMRKHCLDWPYCRTSLQVLHDQSRERIGSLIDWVSRADKAAFDLSAGERWLSGEMIEGRPSLLQIMGHLQALEPLPECLAQIVIQPDRQWEHEIRSFSHRTARDLERIESGGLGFLTVFDFYKTVMPRCIEAPKYTRKLQEAKKCLQARHTVCNCSWRYIRDSWMSEWHWIQVNTDEGRNKSWLCPVTLALEELDLGWGGAELKSQTQARRERARLLYLAQEMRDAGLVRYVMGAKLARNGPPFPSWDAYAQLEWSGTSSLTRLLDTAAEWEIEAASSVLEEWLNDVAEGTHPRIRHGPTRVVRLRQSEEGVSLIRWVVPTSMP